MEIDVRIIHCGDLIPFPAKEETAHTLSIVPCICINRSTVLSEPGIGIKIFNSEERFLFFNGKSYDYSPLHAWRAFFYLNAVLWHIDEPSFKPNDHLLSACWHTASRELLHDHQWAPKKLESIFGIEKFTQVRSAAESSMPSADMLDCLITSFQDERTALDFSEIEEEALAGRLPKTSLILKILEEREQHRIENEAIVEDMNNHRLVSSEESLGEFFRWLGIRDFVVDIRERMYGTHNRKITLIGYRELDVLTAEEGYESYRYNRGKRSFKLLIRVRKNGREDSEHPSFRAPDTTLYTFKSARFKKDAYWIKTEKGKNSGEMTENEYTVKELRAMIGELPIRKKTTKERIREFLMRFTRA
ncbi:MAG: hypothetical protein Q7R79_05340 [bacterium]|nr:hypothetical protein [bacterium]